VKLEVKGYLQLHLRLRRVWLVSETNSVPSRPELVLHRDVQRQLLPEGHREMYPRKRLAEKVYLIHREGSEGGLPVDPQLLFGPYSSNNNANKM
jgi:hypothetical protein